MRHLLLLACVLLLLAGCTQPPVKTVEATVDDKPVLAYDLDEDGAPDTDGYGRILVVPGSEIYKYTETADTYVPLALDAASPWIGGGIGVVLAGLAAAWRQHKFGRILGNLVMSVQVARQRLKNDGLDEALDLVDETLGSQQTTEVTNIVRDTKKKLTLPTVG